MAMVDRWGALAKSDVMGMEEVEVAVVGGGQAGIAMSEHLGDAGIPHVVLERGRIAERWRSWRWDSLVANGPAWHDRFPGLEFDLAPGAFAGKEQIAGYFEAYATKVAAPVRCGVEVTSVRKNDGRPGFTVRTSDGDLGARFVVAATGPFQKPVVPPIIPASAPVTQLHSARYRNPGQLPDGNILVVGGGASGVQIAAELQESGRQVYLSVGPPDPAPPRPPARPPRRSRGGDYCWWLGALGKWALAPPPLGAEHVTIAVSGAHGGHTVDFRDLAAQGITLTGPALSYADGTIRFRDDLRASLATGDANYFSVLDQADAYVARNGLGLPEEPEARVLRPDPDCVTSPLLELDLAGAGVSTVLWATGYATDFGWLRVDAFDASGRPRHQRGVSSEPGVYFLGLPWLSRRGSSFIWGVWHDARYLADQIGIQRSYATYVAIDAPGREVS